jgi:hypothetical protein
VKLKEAGIVEFTGTNATVRQGGKCLRALQSRLSVCTSKQQY